MFKSSEAAVELRNGSRMESRAQQAFHRLSVTSDGDRFQQWLAILAEQPPVLFQFPNGESKESG